MKYCAQCGQPVKDGAKFCSHCGHRFPVIAHPEKKDDLPQDIKEPSLAPEKEQVGKRNRCRRREENDSVSAKQEKTGSRQRSETGEPTGFDQPTGFEQPTGFRETTGFRQTDGNRRQGQKY